ncbi:MAG: hypothetical protein GEU78_19540, partial [Actinobacteria bacterium]|nr:hypothetical protein [Actinomycetota bacterium]
MDKARNSTLAGSRSGRGFRYQDAASASLCVDALMGAPWKVVPEGGDDASLETPDGVIELQIKSRQPHLGFFPIIDLADWLAELDEKHDEDRTLGVLAERDVKEVSPT